ncbi:MAG TPA: OmpH family outer membrane protein [Arachidicoccus soli]|uniref:OmpH family outer membrane protein n=1 Tax=Arachidicoccus soli TaxID=2341117 RepID=A0A386HLN4_9BACT|nr:OmpH family outer membrane protein [Arachidicoccus soli]AYD46284.1 OmpH family outer membrane protein [Arachidicoccus soli]HEU0226161.1 OmpH family outer membrane protein [Arachidicoccus soli]
MKKVIFSLVAIIGLGIATNNVKAQSSLKIGVFDIDQMVSAMPEMKDVQVKMQSYQKDTLGGERDQLSTLLENQQNTYKADSAAKKSQAILDYDRNQLGTLYSKLVNWQQYVQQASQNKYGELTQGMYTKAAAAFKKVVAAQKITLVLKPDVIQYADDKQIVNLFIPVAKELGVNLNAEGNSPAEGK